MADISPNLLLPYILAAQAQKHVTHNEAIKLLDGVVQLGVLSRILTAPPVSPASGDRYIVGSGAAGLWAGWDLNVAFYVDGAWLRLIPRVGWIAYSVADTAFYAWSGSAWIGMPQANMTAQMLGIGGAVADSTNRLSINTPAVLLNNAGAGIEATVNKAAAANDAAFAFKTGFSARALIGLLGSDDFSFKVSPDGSAWNTALTIDRATGRPTLPQGMILGPLAADPSGRADGWLWFNTTAQRLRARADGVDFNLGPLTGTGVLIVADNALEASTVIAAPGVVAGSTIMVSLAAVVDDDENTPELLDIVTLWGEAGIDQITLNATFSDLTSGAVKINWSAN